VRYMLLIYGQEAQPDEGRSGAASAGEPPEITPPWLEYTNWMLREGIHSAGEQLAGSASATTVRVRDGSRLVTDGPYAETKEVLGGYYIIECDNLDDALEAAARCPGALNGSIEVRPIVGMSTAAGATVRTGNSAG
jgi:hypothetical protein